MNITRILLAIALLCISCQPDKVPPVPTSAEGAETFVVAFYNVENLFDAVDDRANFGDDEYTPDGQRRWTDQRYEQKLRDLARAIRSIDQMRGPDVVGLAEIENRSVLERLAGEFLPRGVYGIVHHESPDERGIDVALLYRRDRIELVFTRFHTVELDGGDRTREILEAELAIGRERLTVLVNHWPSRSGGRAESEPKRMRAAHAAASIIDSLYERDSGANILMMGDFNDQPHDRSITDRIGSRMRNLAKPVAERGDIGSYYYQGAWEVIDQMLISPSLRASRGLHVPDTAQQIFAPDFLRDERAHPVDRPPYRTFKGTYYIGGTSDHFAVWVRLMANSK